MPWSAARNSLLSSVARAFSSPASAMWHLASTPLRGVGVELFDHGIVLSWSELGGWPLTRFRPSRTLGGDRLHQLGGPALGAVDVMARGLLLDGLLFDAHPAAQHELGGLEERHAFGAVHVVDRPGRQGGAVFEEVLVLQVPFAERVELFERQAPEFVFTATEVISSDGPDGKPVVPGRSAFGDSPRILLRSGQRPVVA